MQLALIIFIVIFALAIGFFLGLFLLSMNSPLLTKLFQKDETESDDKLPGSTDEALAEVSLSAPQIKKPSPNSQLLMRVWKEEGKPPVYDLNGTYVEKEKLPREVLNIITVQEELSSEPAPTQPVQPPPPAKVDPETPEIATEEEGEPELKMLSVIDEVNDILQKKLHGSPLAGKGIHLMENHNKEIRFWVGLNSYNDVEEIPDPEIRQIIDDSVKEWEESRV